jgi:tetratricopeptide (TPR) repeat protein
MIGPESLDTATALNNLADVRRLEKRGDLALVMLERAQAIYTKIFGPADARIAYPLERIALVYEDRGENERALVFLRRAMEVRKQALGERHADVMSSMSYVAELLSRLRRCDEARPLLDIAIPGLEQTLGNGSALYAQALIVGARCDVVAGKAARAVERIDAALPIYAKAKVPAVESGKARWLETRALWTLGRHDAAVAAARQALIDLDGDADGAADRAVAQAWLAHPR